MSIRLIALDIDGTTLNSKGRLTERTKDALERAIESGVYVVMATGRCFDALPDDIMAISNMNYVVTSNGAMVRDLNTGEVILRNCLDPEVVVEAEKILRDCGQMVEIFIDGTAYIERSLYEYIRDGGDTYRHREYVMKTRNPVDDLMGHLLENRDRIENINIFFNSQETKAAMYPVLLQLENAVRSTDSSEPGRHREYNAWQPSNISFPSVVMPSGSATALTFQHFWKRPAPIRFTEAGILISLSE